MSYGKQAILSHKLLEKNNDDKELVVANCGYFIAYNSPSGLAPKDDNNCYLLVYLHKVTLTLQKDNKQTKYQGCVVFFHPNEMRYISYCNDDVNERYYIFFKGKKIY